MAEVRPAGWRKVGQEWVPKAGAKRSPGGAVVVPQAGPKLPPAKPQRILAPGCEALSRGSVSGYGTIIAAAATVPVGEARTVPVHFDATGAFLLQELTWSTDQVLAGGELANVRVITVQITDTRRNRQLFSEEVDITAIPDQYSGVAHRLPRPYLIQAASDVVVTIRQSDDAQVERTVSVNLHGWRYRGGEGPAAPLNEDFYIYVAEAGTDTLLIEQDYDFVLTQLIGPVRQVTDRKLTRSLFEGDGIFSGLFANPIGDLYALQHPYVFSANGRVTVDSDGPVYLVGYKRWLR